MEEIQFESYDAAKAYGLRMRAQGYRARIKPRGGQWQVVLREKKSGPELPRGGMAAAVEEEYQAPRALAPRIAAPSSAPMLERKMDLSALRADHLGLPMDVPRPQVPRLGNAGSIKEAGEKLKWTPGRLRRPSRAVGTEVTEEEYE